MFIVFSHLGVGTISQYVNGPYDSRVTSSVFRSVDPTGRCPPVMWMLVYKPPWKLVREISTINHSLFVYSTTFFRQLKHIFHIFSSKSPYFPYISHWTFHPFGPRPIWIFFPLVKISILRGHQEDIRISTVTGHHPIPRNIKIIHLGTL